MQKLEEGEVLVGLERNMEERESLIGIGIMKKLIKTGKYG